MPKSSLGSTTDRLNSTEQFYVTTTTKIIRVTALVESKPPTKTD